jgi:hypothetical protein
MIKSLLFAAAIAGSIAATPSQAEPHPHIHAAINELVEARKELQTAAHDFGGHRAAAIKAVDNAIRQLRVAEKYDKK